MSSQCRASASAVQGSVIADIQHDLRSKRRSAAEIMQHYLDSLQHSEPVLGSFITVDTERAMQQASLSLSLGRAT